MKKVLLGLFVLSLLLVFSCNLEAPLFSLDEFEANILAALTGTTVGYAYVIVDEGNLARSGAGGWGRTPLDGSKAMNINQKMHVASISKNITTAAVLRLVEDTSGVNLDTSVSAYFPADWVRGPGITQVTFRELLSHSPGLNNVGNQQSSAVTYDALKGYIEEGAQQPKEADYSNTHHALFRIIIPYVLEETQPGFETTDQFTTRVYQEYIQQTIFDAALEGTDRTRFCTPPPGNPNLYYSFPDDNTGGVGGSVNYSDRSGSFGWHLSVRDLGGYLAYLRHTEDIISDVNRDTMNSQQLGWFNTREGDWGTYLAKTGGWNYASTVPAKGMKACIMDYQTGIQVAVIVNSNDKDAINPMGLAGMLEIAFDDAHGFF